MVTGLTLFDQRNQFFLTIIDILICLVNKKSFGVPECLKYSIYITTYAGIILDPVNSSVTHPLLNFLQAHFPKNIRDLRL